MPITLIIIEGVEETKSSFFSKVALPGKTKHWFMGRFHKTLTSAQSSTAGWASV